jgi:hypothetical protein
MLVRILVVASFSGVEFAFYGQCCGAVDFEEVV